MINDVIKMRLGIGSDSQPLVSNDTILYWSTQNRYWNKCLTGFVSFCEYIKQFDISVMVEIGCFQGESTTILAHYLPNCIIFAVDPFKAGYDDTDISSYANMDLVESNFDERISFFPNIIKMKCDSRQAVSQFSDRCLDLVYIDANHQNVEKDIVDWVGKIRIGGFISGHDYSLVKPVVKKQIGKCDMIFDDESWIKQLI